MDIVLFPIFCCYEYCHVAMNILILLSYYLSTSFFGSVPREWKSQAIRHGLLWSHLERTKCLPSVYSKLNPKHQPYIQVPISLHSCQIQVSSDLLAIVDNIGIKWCFVAFAGIHQILPDMRTAASHLLEVLAHVTFSVGLSQMARFKRPRNVFNPFSHVIFPHCTNRPCTPLRAVLRLHKIHMLKS